MKVKRNITLIKELHEHDDCYVDASPAERVAFVWELTAELWSLGNKYDAEQRLQRNVTNLIRKKS